MSDIWLVSETWSDLRGNVSLSGENPVGFLPGDTPIDEIERLKAVTKTTGGKRFRLRRLSGFVEAPENTSWDGW